PVPAQPFFHFRRITLNPAVNRGGIDIHSAFSQHLLQLTVTDAVFAVPAYGPQNDVTLKMPAFEWVHVQLHQQKGMISLSPPTICNSAPISTMLNTRVHQSEVSMATEALLQRLAAVRGRLSLCADQAAAAKWWLSMPMASVSAEGPMPKALSTRRTSPLMPGCRHQGRACPLRRARMTSNPLIVA
ncbi:putative transposase, partial [Acinetobacter baumannii 1170863]